MGILTAEGWQATYETATRGEWRVKLVMWTQAPDGYVYGLVTKDGKLTSAEKLPGFKGYRPVSA